ncbi:unnamed protein product [Closterium sp. NIES-53]
MLALCREHRLEHRTKHIALRYFLARELQQRGQLRLAYVASEANTADIFTKALAPGDHQRFCTLLGVSVARARKSRINLAVAVETAWADDCRREVRCPSSRPPRNFLPASPAPLAKNIARFEAGEPHSPDPLRFDLHARGSEHGWGAGLGLWPSDPHLVALVHFLVALPIPSDSSPFLFPTALSPHPRLLHYCCCFPRVSPPYKTGNFFHPFQYQVAFKPVVLQTGTHSPDHPLPRVLPAVPLLVLSSLAMVIAGESWLTPSHAAAVSTVSGRSPRASVSGIATLKPPVPPAPKPAPPAAGVSLPLDPLPVTSAALPLPLPVPPAPVVDLDPPPPVEAPARAAPAGLSAVPVNTVAPPAVSGPAVAPPVPGVPASAPAVFDPVAPVAAVASSLMAESSTTAGQAPVVAQAVAVLTAVQVVPDLALPVAAPPARRPPSPGCRKPWPHSPAPRDERAASRRCHDSPRCRGSQENWHATRGGHGGWWGGRGRGGGWVYEQPVTMADLQRAVSAAVREERNGQARERNSPRVAPPLVPPPPVALPVPAAPPPPAAAPPPPAPSAFAVAPPGHVEPLRVPAAIDALSFQAWAGPPRMAEVPEASLGQLWRLAEGLRVVQLIQAYSHAALAHGGSLDDRQRDTCLDAADRLAELLAPVLAAPAMGVIAGVGQLGTAVRGLRRILRAGSGADVISASTAAVRQLHLSLTGFLAVLDADQF